MLRGLGSNQQDLTEDALTARCSTNYAYRGAYCPKVVPNLLYQLSYRSAQFSYNNHGAYL